MDDCRALPEKKTGHGKKGADDLGDLNSRKLAV